MEQDLIKSYDYKFQAITQELKAKERQLEVQEARHTLTQQEV